MTSSQKISLHTFIGGILMIVGTTIGGGMLALPLVTVQGGFLYASIFLTVSWFIMLCGALLMLEVNLLLPEGTNLISMAEITLGKKGKILAWFVYFVLHYSLLSAYVAGGGDVLQHLFRFLHLQIPYFLCVSFFVFVLALILIQGIKMADKANQVIMSVKLLSFWFILFFSLQHLKIAHFYLGRPESLILTTTTMITSFGFSAIIPTLRNYFKSDIRKLRQAIFLGSLIPLVFYLFWEFAIFGSVPYAGINGLQALSLAQNQPISTLIQTLSFHTQSESVVLACNVFTSVCVFTAFIGVSLCLIDFLSDAFRVSENSKKRIFIYLVTFVPPIFLVIFLPKLFLIGLNFAGVCCVYFTGIYADCHGLER